MRPYKVGKNLHVTSSETEMWKAEKKAKQAASVFRQESDRAYRDNTQMTH